jgi:hypothetical protein
LGIFRTKLVGNYKIVRFQEKRKKSSKKKICAKNPKNFRIDAGIISD